MFMIAGMILAPFSRPVMAGMDSDASMPAMADDMSMTEMAAGMADNMPCCPAKAPMPVDCDKCVLMANCMVKCFATPSAAVFYSFALSGQIIPSQNDFWPDSLGRPPPEHPPRTLV